MPVSSWAASHRVRRHIFDNYPACDNHAFSIWMVFCKSVLGCERINPKDYSDPPTNTLEAGLGPHPSYLSPCFALAYAGVARCRLVLFDCVGRPSSFDPARSGRLRSDPLRQTMRAKTNRPARNATKPYARDWLSGNGIVMLEYDNEHDEIGIMMEM
jgi:hypothetical protein